MANLRIFNPVSNCQRFFCLFSPLDFSDYTMVVGVMEAHYTMAILGPKNVVAVCNREVAAL